MPLNNSAAEIIRYGVDVAVITETHLKEKHANSCVNIDNYQTTCCLGVTEFTEIAADSLSIRASAYDDCRIQAADCW